MKRLPNYTVSHTEDGNLDIHRHENVRSLMLYNLSFDNASLNKPRYEFSECVSVNFSLYCHLSSIAK
jgi:hypothetical protein